MAMLYISHSDETERMARIERVKQGIEENKASASVHITRITKELDKGKGHTFSYKEHLNSHQLGAATQGNSVVPSGHSDKSEEEGETSGSLLSIYSAPVVLSGFQVGPSSEGRVIGNIGTGKSQRKRPPSWKRRAAGKNLQVAPLISAPTALDQSMLSKRKADHPMTSGENKNKKPSSVASVLKPLFPQ